MRIALFGGTFDPIHTGHVRAAKAAARKYKLDRILFVPSGSPPHKLRDRLTPFHHRYAMVALACAADSRFVPSLLESPASDRRPHYSVNTVRRAKRLMRSRDELFFIIGADAFLDLPHWKDYGRLLRSVNFIVVSRPGVSLAEITRAVPLRLLQRGGGQPARNTLQMKRTTLSVLEGVDAAVASRDIREAIRAGRAVTGLVPPLVEQYIQKEGLYRPARTGHGK